MTLISHPDRRAPVGRPQQQRAGVRADYTAIEGAHNRAPIRFFHGYYDHYCYLPLYVFCGEHLLCAKLRPSNIDAAAGAMEEIARIVAPIRARWPSTNFR